MKGLWDDLTGKSSSSSAGPTSGTYAPQTTACPSDPPIRTASGISPAESSYIQQRLPKASAGLAAWLKKTDETLPTDNLPVVALANSGGGYRALLSGAGVVQALDGRDGNTALSGLYQGLTYHAGLSGGGWLLSSIAGNNWPTITTLKTTLWEDAFQDSIADPDGIKFAKADYDIHEDLKAKKKAGFKPTIVDVWGRLLSYQLLNGKDGGLGLSLAGLATLPNFTANAVPYPIYSATGVDNYDGQCNAGNNGTQYEMHPFEWGSWDAGVGAFIQTQFLGTNASNGVPTTCYTNYDQLGYILGTSSDIWNKACFSTPDLSSWPPALKTKLTSFLDDAHQAVFRDEYAVYPNPFQNMPSATLVGNQSELWLADGGESHQNDPIWPFLHRPHVDFLFVNDNSDDGSTHYPDGSELHDTYQFAKSAGLTRMPIIPDVSTFKSSGFNSRPTFFGCNTPETLTIIYLPNHQFTYDSGTSTEKMEYTKKETDAMIANGVAVATYNGNQTFGGCVACALVKKTAQNLPDNCKSCFSDFCFN
ncbi:MAG: hypothetical protein M1822_004226 [Bathelium mastoideum]|nr:MAG: hypothetical protein M1822_004226 [Bathelium mastoideum]